MRTGKAILFVVLGVLLVSLSLAPAASAFEARTGEDLVVAADEVIEDDLYLAGSNIRVDGVVRGDLIAVGQTIVVNGQVEGDLMAAGQDVTIGGTVSDDARVAGAVLTLSPGGQIGDDVVGAGFTFEAAPGSAIGGSFLFAGSAARLAGDIEEDVNVGAGGLELAGRVGGDVVAEVGAPEDVPPFSPTAFMPGGVSAPTIPGGLTVADGAQIEGTLDYSSPQRFDVPSGAVAGETLFERQIIEEVEAPQPTVLDGVLRYVRRAVALLLVGLLLLWLAPTWTRQAVDRLQSEPWPSLGWGFIAFAGFFAALFVVGLVTVVLGGFFGLITLGNLATTSVFLGLFALFALVLAFALAATFVTKIVVSYFGGRWILARFSQQAADRPIWSLLLGVLLLTLLVAIPLLGGLINLLALIFGLGALWLLARELWRPAAAEAVA